MKKYEESVANDKVFHLINGKILKSLKELKEEIHIMADEVFFHHVTNSRNDFSNWVKDVIGDKTLAGHIAKAGTPSMLKDVLAKAFVSDAGSTSPAKAKAVKPAATRATAAVSTKKAAPAKKAATTGKTAAGKSK